MYLVRCTRPDLASAVSTLSRNVASPTTADESRLKRVLQYLRYTTFMKLRIGGAGPIIGHCDSNMGDKDTKYKATYGFTFSLGHGAVLWKSKLQRSVSLTTMDAEYFALSEAARHASWLREVVRELTGTATAAPLIKCDNTAAIQIAHNPIDTERSRHIERRLHFVRDLLSQKSLQLVYVKSADNVADVLTKGLPRVPHNDCVRGLGLE